MRRMSLSGVAAALVITVTGCGVSTQPGGSSTAKTKKNGQVVIGFSEVTQQSPFYVQLKNGAQQQATKAGAKLLFADANGDVTKQNNDIQDLITRGVNALLINPVDPKGVAPGIAAAKAANIPVIMVDRPVPSGALSFVGRDNVKMGKLVGEQVAKALGPGGGKVIEIQGDAGGAVARDRGNGFQQGVASNSKIHVVKGPYCNYIRAQAVTAMQDLLQANPDAKAVFAENDDMALGALQVLKENRRGDVKVAGVDGLMEAVKAMSGGQYVATALNDPIHEGDLAVQTAITANKGGKVPAFVDAGTMLLDPSDATKHVGGTVFAHS